METGSCKYGRVCQFAHSKAELKKYSYCVDYKSICSSKAGLHDVCNFCIETQIVCNHKGKEHYSFVFLRFILIQVTFTL